MPWLSRSPSPARATMRSSSPPKMSPSVMTYIPPLIDGACGTMPRAQQATLSQIRADVPLVGRMLPALIWSAWQGIVVRRRTMKWREIREVALQAILTIFELYMLASAVPFWLVLPGALFGLWVAACAGIVWAASGLLNGREEVLRCTVGSEGWMMGQGAEDERWLFVGGMGSSSRALSQTTLPKLSKLFGRRITGIRMATYGLPLDVLSLLLHRSANVPSSTSRAIYRHLRTSLLDSSVTRTVVLVHNWGALPLSQVLAGLYADIPAENMSKLEIYTFGAAASELVVPLGESLMDQPQQPQRVPHYHHHQDMAAERRTPHIEHFAHATDPFAQMGVLHSTREHLQGRFCGGVFVIEENGGGNNRVKPAGDKSIKILRDCLSKPAAKSVTSLDDYLTALFPNESLQPPSTTSRAGGHQPHARSVLDAVMAIDRDVAEKREFAAVANYASSARLTLSASLSADGGKTDQRLSWTGLGATVGGKNGVMDGVVGLELARRGCRECDGRRGREVSWLVRYVDMQEDLGANGQGIASETANGVGQGHGDVSEVQGVATVGHVM